MLESINIENLETADKDVAPDNATTTRMLNAWLANGVLDQDDIKTFAVENGKSSMLTGAGINKLLEYHQNNPA